MTWIQYYIPFIGFRDIPVEITKEVGLEGEYSGFMLSWLGNSLILYMTRKDEQE